jgi:hypothetical protein
VENEGGSMKFTVENVQKGLESLGLKVVKLDEPRVTPRLRGNMEGVRVEVSVSSEDFCWIIVSVRCETGGYTKRATFPVNNIDDGNTWKKQISDLLADNKPAPRRTKAERAPVFLEFAENPKNPSDRFEIRAEHVPFTIARKHKAMPQIEMIDMIEVVNLDGNILDYNIHNPENKPWFHMGCRNHLNATFNILTDGERFMPVNRYSSNRDGKFRTTKVTNPKASVDLTAMNQDDKAMINFAIQAFLEKEV